MAEVTVQRIGGGADNPRLNVVFVHGLGGDADKTWRFQASKTESAFWPEWLAEDFNGLAVYSVGYPADKMGWNSGWPIEEAAVAVLDRLMKNPDLLKSNAPIVFICHSLGGIIVKQLILKANSGRDLNSSKGVFLDRVAGVVFLATPHDGSLLATLASKFGWLVTDTMRDLIANSAKLGDLSDNYRDYVAANEGRIRHLIYYENEGVGVGKVVDAGSANPGIAGADRVPIGRDHIDICKIADRTDQVYEGVLAFLDEALEPRPPTHGEKLDAVKDDTKAIRAHQEQAGAQLAALPEMVARKSRKGILIVAGVVLFAVVSFGLWTSKTQRESSTVVQSQGEKLAAVKDDTKAIRENVERLTPDVEMNAAQREALVGQLAKVKAEYGGTVDLVSGFLETMVGRKIAPEQFAATLFKIAADWKTAGEKIDALTFSGNLSPRLSQLRDQAKAAHLAGRLDQAEALLAQIARDETDALTRLKDHDREVQEEIRLRSLGVAQTKAAQAAVAHARLNYREAAMLYGEAAALVAAFDAKRRFQWLLAQASELYGQGNEFGDNAALGEAIGLYRQCLALAPRERVPLDWAGTQNNLGAALRSLGERESGTGRLEEAVAAYRAALNEVTREREPLDWAMTQMNLGNALATLGGRERGTGKLEEAVAAYAQALKEYTRERVPLDWAMTQNNLGNALRALGERESGHIESIRRLEEAVTAYRLALQEYTRERVPLQWAGTQNNLGTALATLGERESGTARLEEAVAAYHEALKEWTRERVPLDWASTQNNLGAALQTLGERESGQVESIRRLDEAVAAYRAALKEWTREAAPHWHEIARRNLARAEALLAERREGAGK